MQSVQEHCCICFSLVCPLPWFFLTLSCLAPITSHVTNAEGHITRQVACAKGNVACYIPPSTRNCPKHVWHGSKTCLQMPRWTTMGAKGRLGEKTLQPNSCTHCINNYGHICNVRGIKWLAIHLPFPLLYQTQLSWAS
jgi:hypothetical protein